MNKTRITLFAALITILASSIFSFVFLKTDFLIRKWNIPLSVEGFLDARQIGIAAESYAQGYDPMKENLFTAEGYKGLNYPRIWQLLFATGINRNHTNLIGSIFTVLFFIGTGMFWFSRKFDNATYYTLFLAILSPPVMLGIERGNIEVVVFFVVAAALLVYHYSSLWALALFLFAAVLKLYPVFSFIAVLKEHKKKFLILFLAACVIFAGYSLLTLDDLRQINRIQPRNSKSSYGLNVFWMGLTHPRLLNLQLSENVIAAVKYLSYGSLILIVIWALTYGLRTLNSHGYDRGEHLDGFRAGAGIYIGCFLLGNNYDYRLIFLIFSIPQLVAWARSREGAASLIPRATLFAMIFSLWSFFIATRILGQKLTFLLEEFANWMVLAGLLYLLIASLPEWVNDYLPRSAVKIKSAGRTGGHR